jgi:hypothetical protein
MSNVLRGDVTLRQALLNTNKFFKSRLENRERDKVKVVRIKRVQTFSPDRPGAPLVKYIIQTRSTPKYGNYLREFGRRDRDGSPYHFYDVTLELPELSLDVPFKLRVGSGLKPKKAPPSKIKSISRDNLKRWSKEKIRRHRAKRFKYLDAGDWNSQVHGINHDFFYRMSWVLKESGNLFGRNYAGWPPTKTNPLMVVFLDKHTLAVVEALMNRGVFGSA